MRSFTKNVYTKVAKEIPFVLGCYFMYFVPVASFIEFIFVVLAENALNNTNYRFSNGRTDDDGLIILQDSYEPSPPHRCSLHEFLMDVH